MPMSTCVWAEISVHSTATMPMKYLPQNNYGSEIEPAVLVKSIWWLIGSLRY